MPRRNLFNELATPSNLLRDRYIVPPFSILDARQAYWRRKKKRWIKLGIKGEIGRGGKETYSYRDPDKLTRIMNDKGKELAPTYHSQKLAPGGGGGGCWIGGPTTKSTKKFGKVFNVEGCFDDKDLIGTSVFDPVLCEIMYEWFCPDGGVVLDPFAGGSTRGVVATYLGYEYVGIELRQEQIDANEEQADKIGVSPIWIQGDSTNLSKITKDKFDFVWTSPPYYNLEVYSTKESDGSAFASYPSFLKWYKNIFRQAAKRLKKNRFLAVQVGEVRDKKTGGYINFVGDTISIFKEIGLEYFNEMILLTPVGSLAIRVGSQFDVGRKIGKSHQNILVFYKGIPAKIKEKYPRSVKW